MKCTREARTPAGPVLKAGHAQPLFEIRQRFCQGLKISDAALIHVQGHERICVTVIQQEALAVGNDSSSKSCKVTQGRECHPHEILPVKHT